MKRGLRVWAGILLSLAMVQAAGAVSMYRVVDLGSLGGLESGAWRINSSGQIVGGAQAADGYYHAVTWINGQMTDLTPLMDADPQGWATGKATDFRVMLGINRMGATAGTYMPSDGPFRAFLWNQTGIHDLSVSNDTDSWAWDINDKEQVVGRAFLPDGSSRAVIWDGDKVTDLGSFGGSSTMAMAINSGGQVAGWSDVKRPMPGMSGVFQGGTHAFLWENGAMTDLSTDGAGCSWAWDINDLGQAVGMSQFSSRGGPTSQHAAMWENGAVTDLGAIPFAGREFSIAMSINNQGQVVGDSTVGLSPVPGEPNTMRHITHAFIWEKGKLYDMNDLIVQRGVWELNVAADINDSGLIVGFGSYSPNGAHKIERRAFLLRPAGEKPEAGVGTDLSSSMAEPSDE